MSRRKQLNPKPLKTSGDVLIDPTTNDQAIICVGNSYTTITTTTTSHLDLVAKPSLAEGQQQTQTNLLNNTNETTSSDSNSRCSSTTTTTSCTGESDVSFVKSNPVKSLSPRPKQHQSRKKKRTSPALDSNSHVDKVNEEKLNSNQQPKSNNSISNSILINGKRYYPLIFSCENCGLRYSDQSTLTIHKQNYCSKRHQASSRSTSTSSSKRSSSNCSSNTSRSRSASNDEKANTTKINSNKPHTKQCNEQIEKSLSIQSANRMEENKQELTTSMPLIKSVIYQCNSCLFQTDKKSIMNRHSRVHLAQKRKAMEEPNKPVVEPATQVEEKKSPTVEKQSYCTDCDIQFSSINTFQHHRNNYCQKYKTIEAIVPLDQLTGTQEKVSGDKQSCQEKSGKPKRKLNVSGVEADLIMANRLQTKGVAPTGAVQMGDMVYLPLFKVSEQSNKPFHSILTPNSMYSNLENHENMALSRYLQNAQLIQQINSMQVKVNSHQLEPKEHDESLTQPADNTEATKHFSNSPLDLSKKSYKTEIKEVIQTNPLAPLPNKVGFFLYQQQQQQPSLPQVAVAKQLQNQNYNPASSNYLFSQQQLQQSPHHPAVNGFANNSLQVYGNNAKFKPISQPPLVLPPFHRLNSSGLPIAAVSPPRTTTPLLMPPLHPPAVQNKIYHCRQCQQLFLKLKAFKRHICNNLNELMFNNQGSIRPVEPAAGEQLLNRISSQTKIEKTNSSFEQIDESLLKHPLVKKTFKETYNLGGLAASQLSDADIAADCPGTNKSHFFICTSCGYRGNTARGVKQHGKMHLAQREHFAVINITDEPSVVYNSSNDKEFQAQCLNFSHTQAESNEKTMLKRVRTEDPVEENKTTQKEPEEKMSNAAPFSKKARLLDSHYSQQKILNESDAANKSTPVGNIVEQTSSLRKLVLEPQAAQLNSMKEKSQTYCSKCNIQFQQVGNFLAHKKLYCK